MSACLYLSFTAVGVYLACSWPVDALGLVALGRSTGGRPCTAGKTPGCGEGGGAKTQYLFFSLGGTSLLYNTKVLCIYVWACQPTRWVRRALRARLRAGTARLYQARAQHC